MIKPVLDHKNTPQGFSTILHKFEVGEPLTPDELHFIESNERALSNSTLDPILRYYLREHHLNPEKAMPLELPVNQAWNELELQDFRDQLLLVLKDNLDHVDLQLTKAQYRRFQAATHRQIIFWRGNQFLPGSLFFHGGLPYRIYFQWGKMFGVVKFNFGQGDQQVEGKVLIYLEDRQEKNIQECIKAYTAQLKQNVQQDEKQNLTKKREAPLVQATPYKLPTPRPGQAGFYPEEER